MSIPIPVVVAAVLFAISQLTFFVIFVKIYVHNRSSFLPYSRYGKTMALIIFSLEALLIGGLAFVNSESLSFERHISILVAATVGFAKVYLFTNVGISYSIAMGKNPFPIVSKRWPMPGIKNNLDSRSTIVFVAMLSALAFFLYSVALFQLTSPEIGEVVSDLLKDEQGSSSMGEISIYLSSLIVVVVAAVVEELVFRLGIQSYLAKCFDLRGSRYWFAIVAVSLIWTLGHIGSLNPDWVKVVQIFPVGLALGWMFRRYGIECCILSHLLLNVALVPLSSTLISGG